MHAPSDTRPKGFDALAREVVDTGIGVQILCGKPKDFLCFSCVCCGVMAAAMTPDVVTNAVVAALSTGAVAGGYRYRQVGHRRLPPVAVHWSLSDEGDER